VIVCFRDLSVLSIIAFKIAEVLVGNRVSKEVEIAGLDMPEMGAPGYSGFVMDKAGETPSAKSLNPSRSRGCVADDSSTHRVGAAPIGKNNLTHEYRNTDFVRLRWRCSPAS